jgi:hypothetical protein
MTPRENTKPNSGSASIFKKACEKALKTPPNRAMLAPLFSRAGKKERFPQVWKYLWKFKTTPWNQKKKLILG